MMSGYNVWSYTDVDVTSLANQAKEQIIYALHNEGLLKGDPEEIARSYVIVLYTKGLLGSLWDRWRGTKKDASYLGVLKAVSSHVPRGEDENRKPAHLKVVPMPEKKND